MKGFKIEISRAALAACLVSLSLLAAPSFAAALDTKSIEAATGLKGTWNETEGVFKVTLPRKDIQPTVAGVKLVPDQGLGAWAAFTAAGDHAMVMGDIVLREAEVNPVMSVALDNGLQVTALHNHFLWDSPRVMFMHIGGMGEQDSLARAVGQVFNKVKEFMRSPPGARAVNIDPSRTSLDTKAIERVLGHSGTPSGGVFKVVIGREATMGGHRFGKEMGLNTWAVFAGSDELAVVDGDFAMLEGEVQNVLKALRAADIDIVALHNHMVGESPRFVFLHYWGVGPAANLAQGLRAALDTQAPR
jgi:hypothetical protein